MKHVSRRASDRRRVSDLKRSWKYDDRPAPSTKLPTAAELDFDYPLPVRGRWPGAESS